MSEVEPVEGINEGDALPCPECGTDRGLLATGTDEDGHGTWVDGDEGLCIDCGAPLMAFIVGDDEGDGSGAHMEAVARG